MDTNETVSVPAAAPAPAYAGFWRRVGAALIDSIILGIVVSAIVAILGLDADEQPVMLLLGWLYSALMESSKHQATIGKLALNLRVTDEAGARISFPRATGRHFAKILSALILCIGFLMVIWTEKKQGLHDKLAKTLVIKK